MIRSNLAGAALSTITFANNIGTTSYGDDDIMIADNVESLTVTLNVNHYESGGYITVLVDGVEQERITSTGDKTINIPACTQAKIHRYSAASKLVTTGAFSATGKCASLVYQQDNTQTKYASVVLS